MKGETTVGRKASKLNRRRLSATSQPLRSVTSLTGMLHYESTLLPGA